MHTPVVLSSSHAHAISKPALTANTLHTAEPNLPQPPTKNGGTKSHSPYMVRECSAIKVWNHAFMFILTPSGESKLPADYLGIIIIPQNPTDGSPLIILKYFYSTLMRGIASN